MCLPQEWLELLYNDVTSFFTKAFIAIYGKVFKSSLLHMAGLKHRVTRGPHETQRKVSQAEFKKVKKITIKFSAKN